MRGVVSHRASLANRLLSKMASLARAACWAVSQNTVSCRGFESQERYGPHAARILVLKISWRCAA